MHDHCRLRVFAPQFENLFERKLLVDVACTVPQHHIVATRQLLDIGAEIAVGSEDYRLFARYAPDDLQSVRRRAADVGQSLHPDGGIDIRNDLVTWIFRLESGECSGIARLGERAASLGIRYKHLFVGREHLSGLRHEVYAGEQDDVSIGILRLYRQRQRVAEEIGRLLHFGRRIVMGEYYGILLAFEFGDSFEQFRLVIDHDCYCLVFFLFVFKFSIRHLRLSTGFFYYCFILFKF